MKYILILLLALFVSTTHAAEKYRILVSKNCETLLFIKVDGKKQEVVLKSPISFGGAKTEVGFYVSGQPEELTKARTLSKQMGKPIYMAHCLRFVSGPVAGICLHQGDIETDSHGCIRCPRETALAIFKKAYPGLVMEIVDDFTGQFKDESKADRSSLWVKSGVWPTEPSKHISELLRVGKPVGGGNKINFVAETVVTLEIAALVRGRSVIDSHLHENGQMFEGLDKNVAAYIASLPPTKSSFIRYLNKEKGTDLFLLWTGNSSIWVSRNSVNDFIRKLAVGHGEREDRMSIGRLF